MISAVIFDLDGVLVDLVEGHYLSLNKALLEVTEDYEINREEHLLYYNGISTKSKLETLINRGLLNKKDYNRVWELKQKYTQELIESFDVDIQKCKMLEELKKNYRLICCSNSIRNTIETVLTKTGIIQYLDFFLGNEDFGNRIKPDPYPYQLCFEKLKIDAKQCLIVEDSPKGLQAALASKANVLKVKDPSEVTLDNILNKIKGL